MPAYRALEHLEKSGEGGLSAQELASRLGASHEEVLEYLGELREKGYVVSKTSGGRYVLPPENDLLSREGMRPFLSRPEMAGRLYIHKILGSTNDEARRLSLSGAPEGTAVFAEEQTGGRGRRGRDFFSPPLSGLYMSVILRPRHPAKELLLCTAAAAVAVTGAAEAATGREARIKWVNDIFLDGRKVCGILAETASAPGEDFPAVILGIGVNFRLPAGGFLPGIEGVAGALFGEKPAAFSRNRLAAEILNRTTELSGRLEDRGFLPAYREKSMVLGKKIYVTAGGGTWEGTALSIDDQGGLIVRDEAGRLQSLSTGEITIREAGK